MQYSVLATGDQSVRSQWATCSPKFSVQLQVIKSWSQWATCSPQCSVLTDLQASSGTTLIEMYVVWWYHFTFLLWFWCCCYQWWSSALSYWKKRSALSSQMPSNSSNLPSRSFTWANPFPDPPSLDLQIHPRSLASCYPHRHSCWSVHQPSNLPSGCHGHLSIQLGSLNAMLPALLLRNPSWPTHSWKGYELLSNTTFVLLSSSFYPQVIKSWSQWATCSPQCSVLTDLQA